MQNLGRDFYERKPQIVAKELLGKFLVHKISDRIFVGKIVETEAYLGEDDKASHSYRGKTKRNAVMFGPAGHSYVYFTYGMHWLLNFVTEKEGHPSAVLIRAVEPLTEITKNMDLRRIGSGPARLTKWLEITGEQNDLDVTKSRELFVADEITLGKMSFISKKINKNGIAATVRIGVDYAAEHKDLPLRFYLEGNRFISKK